MQSYSSSVIRPDDRRALRMQRELLEHDGIRMDRHIDYSIGIYNEDYQLVATGSCFKNTVRCLAVHTEYQGEGLFCQLMSQLSEYQFNRGNRSLFLYGRYESSPFFYSINFYDISSTHEQVVLMENTRNGFQRYLSRLIDETPKADIYADTLLSPVFSKLSSESISKNDASAVILSGSNISERQLWTLKRASAESPLVHVFVLSEDASSLSYDERFGNVKEAASCLPNICLHSTGSYIISQEAFPTYFLTDESFAPTYQASLDAKIYGRLCDTLGITCRYLTGSAEDGEGMVYYRELKHFLREHSLPYVEA